MPSTDCRNQWPEGVASNKKAKGKVPHLNSDLDVSPDACYRSGLNSQDKKLPFHSCKKETSLMRSSHRKYVAIIWAFVLALFKLCKFNQRWLLTDAWTVGLTNYCNSFNIPGAAMWKCASADAAWFLELWQSFKTCSTAVSYTLMTPLNQCSLSATDNSK